MNYTFLSDFCTIYRIPRFQEKLNTLYPNFDQKRPYTWIEIAQDTVYPKPLAGPDKAAGGEEGKARMEGGRHDKQVASSKLKKCIQDYSAKIVTLFMTKMAAK